MAYGARKKRIRASWLAGSALGLLSLATVVAAQPQAAPSVSPVDLANPLVGTAPLDRQDLIGNSPPPGEQLYSGITSPGARLPQSSTELAPINANLDASYPAGVPAPYYYPNPTMIGFTGGGAAGRGDPVVMPVVGDWTVPPQYSQSAYDKSREKASPGYYSVDLDTFHTRAEMTATQWTGLFRFTFPETDRANVVINLGRPGGEAEIVGDHTVRGRSVGDGHGGDRAGGSYFVAEFSRPFSAFGTFRQVNDRAGEDSRGEADATADRRTISGAYAGGYVTFRTTAGEQVLMKIAHGHSYEEAEQRLRDENPGWDFERLHDAARAQWASMLGRIEVSGGTAQQRSFFYSTLFQSLASPRLVARKGEQFTDLHGQVKTADHDRYGPVPFWDTGRNQIVLLEMLEPEVVQDIMRSELDMARERGFMNTSFHGDNAVFLYLGAWRRGIAFDYASVWEYLHKNATDPAGPRGYLAEYQKQGWISDIIPDGDPSPPYAGGKAGAATTLEYAWDDHALAQYAKRLGREDDYRTFFERAHNYRNVFDPSVGFMRGRTGDGKWIGPFDPQEPYYNFMMKEASGWSTLWLAPHDVQGLMNLLGGREAFNAKLDRFFNTPYRAKGICRDCTGMVGQYVQGNQPDQQAAYYYDWGGQPWKTQALVRRILTTLYGSDHTGYGYPGMDDQGATSSWYALSAMGFYPVDPSSEDYILGSPLFDDVRLHMGNGHTLEIVAHNNSPTNIYIQSAKMNGKPWTKPWFSHSDIRDGAKLELVMGPTPNPAWGSAPGDAPPSMSRPASR